MTDATTVQEAIEAAEKPPAACSDCERAFRYGEIVMRPNKSQRIICENCARRDKSVGHAVVFGGGKSSVFGRDRAARKLKKLARLKKRSGNVQV